MTQKTTDEIRTLLINARIDFESVENKALNDYLPKIFQICPFTEDICTTKQCLECTVSKNSDKQNSELRHNNQINRVDNNNQP